MKGVEGVGKENDEMKGRAPMLCFGRLSGCVVH
jgi:hypothetical protein